MSISLCSIHMYSKTVPAGRDEIFRSFSQGWQTCTAVPEDPRESIRLSRKLSKETAAPVLYFFVFDSEYIFMEVYSQGKLAARYDDNGTSKKLYDIPGLFGLPEGQKRRLSAILNCSDTELKIAMLEEYLGLCLLYLPEMEKSPEALCRSKGDALFLEYQQQEKHLTGKSAPYRLTLVNTYPGKLFEGHFMNRREITAKSSYLYGYAGEETGNQLTPVVFADGQLKKAEKSIMQPRPADHPNNPLFDIRYGQVCSVTFSRLCPAPYRDKAMNLPAGFWPMAFTAAGKLLLVGRCRLFVVDESLKIVAKLSFQGKFCGISQDYILTEAGGSFYAYEYNPKAKIRIYKLETHLT